jgi:photosystem II stability/assembly factor-like uncharacterized protein
MNQVNKIGTGGDVDALKWRCIGPSRGGRVVAVAGDPSEPMVFYFGGCAGGVWKTVDGGIYWRCVTDGFLGTAAIGALAVAPSDRNVIYAGTGETTIRLDVSYGDGVYKSTDGGRTWRHIGLRNSKHIGRICVHPQNPDIVFVAALGDIFGPHEERGVYRSLDGGATWTKVLHRNADSGAVELSMDTKNPRIVFATIWQTRRNFWNISSGGAGSGLFRSMDGGDTWEEISTSPGLPDGPLGKIGVAVSPACSGRVWALVEAVGEKTGLYRSEDYGARWTKVSSNRDLMHRPWYYTHVFADPVHAETVYVTNLGMWKSTDGGTSFSEIMTPHGDNHDLWIDPRNPQRMVEGNDGGACVSFNGGLTWSSIYNQLTAQFYRIDIDNQYPYRVYGTQQDNTSISTPSAMQWGAITLGDCTYPGTGESGFIAVHPQDPNIVYCGAVGSSPGGAGALQRYDHRSGQIRLINVWPEESTGVAPKDLKYRFAWTYPIVFSPHDSGTLYAGGNHVFRTTNEGMSWDEISPDLSLNDISRQDHSGGEITRESAGAEVHATCACVVESPHRKGEIWASTDDGLVHVTRDGGSSWTNVTPPGMPELAYVGCVEVSPHDPDTVYVAATRYKLADYAPYVFRSKDSGRTWLSINGDMPEGEITRVVRADPVCAGLLFVGTETGVFTSLDDGATWSRMSGGFPVVPVYDMKIKESDLVVGTHGRSFWILDDISPLREMAAKITAPHLFAPRTTVRTRMHFGALGSVRSGVSFGITFGIGGGIATVERPDGTKVREHLDVGENPPNGVIVYYWIDAEPTEPVSLTFRTKAGKDVIAFKSDDSTLAAAKRPTTRRGLNRFVWDMKYPGPPTLDPALVPPKPKPLSTEPDGQSGPTAVPGDYQVEMVAGGKTMSADFKIVKDPRYPATQADYEEQFALLSDLFASLAGLNGAVDRIRRLTKQVDGLSDRGGATHADLAEKLKTARGKLMAIEGILVNLDKQSPRDVLRHPAGLNETLIDCVNTASVADAAPTVPTTAVSREVIAAVAAELAKLDAVITNEIAEINRSNVATSLQALVG